MQLTLLGVFAKAPPSEPGYEEDGEIKITDLVHVQVGYDYACVNRWADARMEGLVFGTMRQPSDLRAIAADIRTAMAA